MRKQFTVILGRNGSGRNYEVQSVGEKPNGLVPPLDLSQISNYNVENNNVSPRNGFYCVETSPTVSPFRRSESFKRSSRSIHSRNTSNNEPEQQPRPKEKQKQRSLSSISLLGQAFTKPKELEKRYSSPLQTRKDSKLRSGAEASFVSNADEEGVG